MVLCEKLVIENYLFSMSKSILLTIPEFLTNERGSAWKILWLKLRLLSIQFFLEPNNYLQSNLFLLMNHNDRDLEGQ